MSKSDPQEEAASVAETLATTSASAASLPHAELRAALEHGQRAADPGEVAASDERLEQLLEQVSLDKPGETVAEKTTADAAPADRTPTTSELPSGMRCAQVVRAEAGDLRLRLRGWDEPVAAQLGPGVALEVIQQAQKNGDFVVIDCVAGETPWIMGALQSRMPSELQLRADKIQLEANQEILLRSGRGAVRLRSDGDVELVGSRISAMSRGLFRLVGRVLRLN